MSLQVAGSSVRLICTDSHDILAFSQCYFIYNALLPSKLSFYRLFVSVRILCILYFPSINMLSRHHSYDYILLALSMFLAKFVFII
ncbi:hypothetical protein K505DRAFT_11315 [Melanomma pulvis-pyrius CBS 109.77]|uniref:Uncharacterized protein n=1 Tax=Melanomma pulvis-pyrius CBS 109.77 TaxID=1314802 RepID=A0A6A6XGE0_9PLEO|nr:hypothetical protein K505DRAFT_11315 [Melanomma pulvis-pyrius CBS 109.77]